MIRVTPRSPSYEYSTDNAVSWTIVPGSAATTTSYTITGLTNYTSYTFAFRAVNPTGDGVGASVTAVPAPAPPAPTGLVAATAEGQVTLSWDDPGDTTITNYEYSANAETDNPSWADVPGSDATTTSYTITGLINNTSYTLAVRAVNATGYGAVFTVTVRLSWPSGGGGGGGPVDPVPVFYSVGVAVVSRPAKPAGVVARAGDGKLTLGWDHPGDLSISGYQLSGPVLSDGLSVSGGGARDQFGVSVAVDGDVAVVGAWRDDTDAGVDAGSVYVFSRGSGGVWREAARLVASDGAAGDRFGVSVGVSGGTVVVGAYGDDDGRGAVYVFSRGSLGVWGEAARLVASDGAVGDRFGVSVGVSGGTVVVGAHAKDVVVEDEVWLDSGAVYVFAEPVGGWVSGTETTRLVGSGVEPNRRLGRSVAVEGRTVVVGAYGYDDEYDFDGRGSVYVFTEPVGGWVGGGGVTETVRLFASDGVAGDWFGWSVGLEGDTAVVGARMRNDGGGGVGSGSAYVFVRSFLGVWSEAARLVASDGVAQDQFGFSVAVDGGRVVVGAWRDDDRGRDSGSVYFFSRPEGGWADTTETYKLVAADGEGNDRFGVLVAVDGDVGVFGAYKDDIDGVGVDSGSVYVVGLPGWTDIPNSDATTTRHVVSGLMNGVSYVFRVRAVNTAGVGLASDSASGVPMPRPDQPTGLFADPGDTQVRLSWDDPDDVSVIGYQYRQQEGADGTFGGWVDVSGGDAGAVGYTVRGLTNGVGYGFGVRAVNEIGNGPASSEVGVTPVGSTPDPPDRTGRGPGRHSGKAELGRSRRRFGHRLSVPAERGPTGATALGPRRPVVTLGLLRTR